ncbi:hypothetical protein [Microcoleus sp.]|uniref:hypothetical protein n=1 Tax=Microcoleus sp. TaxID=44472 RepID=UPI003593FD5D
MLLWQRSIASAIGLCRGGAKSARQVSVIHFYLVLCLKRSLLRHQRPIALQLYWLVEVRSHLLPLLH